MTTDYKEHDNAFNGKVVKVVINVKEIGAAVKASAAIIEAARGALEAAK